MTKVVTNPPRLLRGTVVPASIQVCHHTLLDSCLLVLLVTSTLILLHRLPYTSHIPARSQETSRYASRDAESQRERSLKYDNVQRMNGEARLSLQREIGTRHHGAHGDSDPLRIQMRQSSCRRVSISRKSTRMVRPCQYRQVGTKTST